MVQKRNAAVRAACLSLSVGDGQADGDTTWYYCHQLCQGKGGGRGDSNRAVGAGIKDKPDEMPRCSQHE